MKLFIKETSIKDKYLAPVEVENEHTKIEVADFGAKVIKNVESEKKILTFLIPHSNIKYILHEEEMRDTDSKST